MGAFEHVISLLSFVYALAITHVLLTVAAIVRAWPKVKLSLPHSLWLTNALLNLIADWISFYDLRGLKRWSMWTIFLMLILAFSDYLTAAMVCPEIVPNEMNDLQAFHATQSRRYIVAFMISAVVGLYANFVADAGFHVAEWNAQNLAVAPMILIAATAALLRVRWVQIASPLLLIGVWVYFFTALQGPLA